MSLGLEKAMNEIAWGSAILHAERQPEFFARHPVTGKPHPVLPHRCRVLCDGEDVTGRVREADAVKGEVTLLVPAGKSASGRLVVWKLNAEKTGPELELRRGRVEILYDWPDVTA